MFLVVLAFIIGLVLVYVINQKQVYKLTEHIPGPACLPIVGSALEIGTKNKEFLLNLQRLMKKYGGIVRLCIGSQNGVLLTDPKYIGQVLSTTQTHHKGDLYDIVKPLIGNGLITSSGDKWVRDRRILNAAFSNKQLEKYVGVFNETSNILLERLKEKVNLESVDIVGPIFDYTINSICKAAMRINITEVKQYHSASRKLTDLFLKRFFSPIKRSNFIYRLTSDYWKMKTYAKVTDDFVQDVITRRREEHKEKRATSNHASILDELFRSSEEDRLTDEEIRDQVKSFIFAGSDTVGITISFALYELSKAPDVQQKILEEVEYVLGTADLEADINFENLCELKYTECVLKETLRLYSPVPLVTRVLQDKMYFDDICVPANTTMMIFMYGLHRSEKVYPNPNKFDPDRFLPENIKDRHAYAFIPFAGGPRVCIGLKFAMLEAKLTLAKVIRRFEISSVPAHEPIIEWTGTLNSANGLPVVLKLRKDIKQNCLIKWDECALTFTQGYPNWFCFFESDAMLFLYQMTERTKVPKMLLLPFFTVAYVYYRKVKQIQNKLEATSFSVYRKRLGIWNQQQRNFEYYETTCQTVRLCGQVVFRVAGLHPIVRTEIYCSSNELK